MTLRVQQNPARLSLGALLLALCASMALPARSTAVQEHRAQEHAAAEHAAKTTALEGKLVSLPGRPLSLRTQGKDVPLAAKETFLLHTLEDQRLENRQVRLEGTMKPDGRFEVAHLYTLRDGKLYRVRYYCEICNIAALEPGPCVCCQRPTGLQEIPVSETDTDTVAE